MPETESIEEYAKRKVLLTMVVTEDNEIEAEIMFNNLVKAETLRRAEAADVDAFATSVAAAIIDNEEGTDTAETDDPTDEGVDSDA